MSSVSTPPSAIAAADAEHRSDGTHRQPADRDRRAEDRRVDAHHPAAELVRDGELDRRVAGRRHEDRPEPDEHHQPERDAGRLARERERERRRAEEERALSTSRIGRGRPPKTSRIGGQQRADARRRHQEPVAGGAAPELALGEGRDQHAEVHADGRDRPDDDDRQQHDLRRRT